MEEKLIKVIKDEIIFLENMIDSTIKGGWSTNNVKAQRDRAIYLKTVIYDIENKK